MNYLRLVVVLCCVVLIFADDSKSIDGGFHYDYGKDRAPADPPAKPEKDTSSSHYYPRKYKRRKIEYMDGLPIYRD